MLETKYCPFVNGNCRSDCTFKTVNTSASHGILSCLIAIKLDQINEFQSDQLTELKNHLDN